MLAELAAGESVVRGLHVEDADVIGPAVVHFVGGEVRDSHFEGEVDAIIWDIPAERQLVIGAIALEGCTFTRCRFSLVGIAGNHAQVTQMLTGVTPPRP